MKILMVTHGFPPECSGGTEFYALRLCLGLKEAGVEVAVFTGSHAAAPAGVWEPVLDRDRHEGIPVYRIHRTGLYVDNWERSLAPEVEKPLAEVLRAEKPDLVHVHHWIRLSRTLIETCHGEGVPAVCTLHDLWTTCPIAFRVRDGTLCHLPAGGASCNGCAPRPPYMAEDEAALELDLFRDDHRNEVNLARRIIVPSNAHRDALLPHIGDMRGRFRVVPHGNISAIAPGSGRPGGFPASGELQIAHWGHLTAFKGIDILLEALRGIDPARHPYRLHLFGTVVYPQERERIDALARDLPVAWHGSYKPADLAAVPMDLAVIPSRCSESWSFVLDEALLLGVPVFVSDRGALRERVGSAGAVIRADDPGSLRSAIEEVFRKPGLLEEWRAAPRSLPSMGEHVEKILAVYREVLSSRAPLPGTPPELRQRRIRLKAQQVERRYRALMHAEGLTTHLKGRAGQLERELAALQPKLKAAEEAAGVAAAKRETVQSLRRELAEMESQLQRLQDISKTQEEQFAKLKTLAEVQERQIEELRRDSLDKGRELSHLRQLTSARAGQLRHLRQQRDELESRTRQVVNERDALLRTGKMDRHIAEFQRIQLAFDELARELDPVRLELLLQGEAFLDETVEQLRKTSGEIASLLALLSAKDAHAAALHGTIADLRREATALREENRRQEATARGMAVRIADIEKTADSLREALTERDIVIDDLSHNTDRLLSVLEERERKRASLSPASARDVQERLKILMVVHQFLPAHVAGTELYTHALARALSSKHDVLVLTAESDHRLKRFTERDLTVDGLRVHQVIHNYRFDDFRDTYDCPRADGIFRRLLKSEKPDIVHIQHLHYWSANFITIARQAGVPVVYTLHDFMLMCPKDGTLRRDDGELCLAPIPKKCADCIGHHQLSPSPAPAIPRSFHPSADALLTKAASRTLRMHRGLAGPDASEHEIAAAERLDYLKQILRDVSLFLSPSQFLKERMVASGLVYADRILVSDNGYDLDRLPPFEARKPGEQLRVGFIGTLAEHKGAHILVEAMNGIEDPRVSCQIWGEVRHFPKYVQRLRDLSTNPRTTIPGSFPPDQLDAVLSRLDLLVVPSLWFENSPLTIHEAAAAGLPVLASDHGGLAEFVQPGVNGRLFKAGHPGELRRQILDFLKNPLVVPKGALKIKDVREDATAMESHYRTALRRAALHGA